MRRTLVAALLAVLTLGIGSAAIAAEAEDLIKYRKSVMKAIGGHTAAIFAIAGGKVDNQAHLAAHVSGLAASAMMVKDVFPADSAAGETEAKPEIWQQTDDFAAAVKQFEDAAGNLAGVVEAGNMDAMGDALKALGGSCKNCHDNFRVKKE
jgi:cytochrome c556